MSPNRVLNLGGGGWLWGGYYCNPLLRVKGLACVGVEMGYRGFRVVALQALPFPSRTVSSGV